MRNSKRGKKREDRWGTGRDVDEEIKMRERKECLNGILMEGDEEIKNEGKEGSLIGESK